MDSQSELKIDTTLKTKDLYRRSLVYIWKNSLGEVLYVGQSSKGLGRLFNHDIIGRRYEIDDDDIIEIIYTSEPRKLESELIILLKPRYNSAIPNNKRLERYKTKICVDCRLEFKTDDKYKIRCGLCIAKPLSKTQIKRIQNVSNERTD